MSSLSSKLEDYLFVTDTSCRSCVHVGELAFEMVRIPTDGISLLADERAAPFEGSCKHIGLITALR